MGRDPASLENLHDIVVPEAVGWWPVAPGWYVLALLVITVVVWFGFRRLRRWRRNAYRREALKALAALEADGIPVGTESAVLAQAAILLRRVALSAYPRRQVATLVGERWLAFLDETSGGGAFAAGPGRVLLEGAYQPALPVAGEAVHAALVLCADWIRSHRSGGA
jgi:hypothetical protein